MYAKLFSQMYDGTLCTKGPWQALVTLQQMIILADPDGVIDMTPEAISRRTTIPLEIINEGIKALEDVDNESRSIAENGRRIIRLTDSREWGWQIVNFLYYHKLINEADRREKRKVYHREYQAARRERQKNSKESIDVTNVNKCQQMSNELPHKDEYKYKDKYIKTPTNESGESLTSIEKFHVTKTTLPHNYGISDEVRKWAATKGYTADLEQYLEAFKLKAEANGYQKSSWDSSFKTSMLEDWGKVREKKKTPNQGKTALQILEEREAERAKNGLG